jgi:pimeloyl-ACP methyl ester carboxylesterase
LTALAVAPRSAIRLVTQTEKRTFMSSNGTLACCSFLQEQPDFLKEAVTGGLVLQEEMILSWHLEYDWESPVWRHLWRGLARENTLIRYDARGNGLSDWEVDDISLDAWVSDVETVVDAIGLERFPLVGISQGSAISIAYAVRHPERVSHLILYGGFALGANKCSGADKAQRQAMVTLMRLGWGLAIKPTSTSKRITATWKALNGMLSSFRPRIALADISAICVTFPSTGISPDARSVGSDFPSRREAGTRKFARNQSVGSQIVAPAAGRSATGLLDSSIRSAAQRSYRPAVEPCRLSGAWPETWSRLNPTISDGP